MRPTAAGPARSGLPMLFNGRAHTAASAPPRVGQHTFDVLREFGFEDDEIEALLAAGVVSQYRAVDAVAVG